jgi:hypothetical protein
MLDFNNILATPGADIQYFSGPATTTLLQWQTWRKPRGARWIHMIGVGGGGGGGTGINTTTTSGGGAGGSSGGQTTVMIPAMFVPDTLYIQAGAGGAGATTSGGLGTAGTITYVCIEPYQTAIGPAGTLLLATGGTVTTAAATSTAGGTAPGAVAAATLGGMCLAGRGFYTLLAGQVGVAGGASNLVGSFLTLPTTGLMVTGGVGGGGAPGVGGGNGGAGIFAITGALGEDFFPAQSVPGGTGATGSTPATAASAGFSSRNNLFNFGGTGGGGASTTAGGVASAGGDGAPGSGGGGGGGMTTTNPTIAKGGNGGAGFVYIITI